MKEGHNNSTIGNINIHTASICGTPSIAMTYRVRAGKVNVLEHTWRKYGGCVHHGCE